MLLYLSRSLDFETDKQFNLTITISDLGEPESLSTDQLLTISILQGSDDEQPDFIITSYSFEVSEYHPVGLEYPIGQVVASDEDVSAAVFYSI